jgi:hypothetical protein
LGKWYNKMKRENHLPLPGEFACRVWRW